MCGLFICHNNYGYCDYSILTEDVKKLIYGNGEIKKDTILNKEISKSKDSNKTIKVNENNSTKTCPHNSFKSESCNKIIEKDTVKQKITQIPLKTCVKRTENNPILNSKYSLITILTICFGLYMISDYLVGKKIIKKHSHKKIWNVLLLLSFLATGLLGLFMVIQLNYGFQLSWFRNLLYWHVQIGIGMASISIFHILWHLKYFKRLLGIKKRETSN